MTNSHTTGKKSWKRRILKIFLILVILFCLLLGGASIYVYYKGNDLLKEYLITTVDHSTKGLYRLELKKLNINLLNGRITLRGFHLIPDTALYNQRMQTDTLSPMLIDASINEFQVRGFTLRDIIRNRQVDISKILIEEPVIKLIIKKTSPKAEKHASNPKMLSIPLPKGLKSIQVNLIKLEKGKLTVEDHTKDTMEVFSIPSIDVSFENLLVDSTHTGMRRILNTDDIQITLKGLQIKTKDGMYTITPGEISLSTGKALLTVKNLHVKPNYSYHDFSRKLGYQMDRMDISIRQIDLQRIDLRQLLINRKFIVGKVLVDGLNVEDYRDKRVPNRPNFKPPLLHTALVKSKGYIKIDTVKLTNGKVTYSEQVHDVPGSIFFDNMGGTIFNITNDSALVQKRTPMKVFATMYLMGRGKLNAEMIIPLGDPNEAFTFSGTMTDMDLTLINPMVMAMVPAEVVSGTISKMIFANVQATNKKSLGRLDLYYTNLHVKVVSEDDKNWSKIKSGIFTFAGNTFVRNENPHKNGTFTEGVIYFERDVYKSIFNYLWKSLFSGIKSTIGVNKKEQKEIKKEEKKEKKELKKEQKKEEKMKSKKK